ncbi:hypothetical protein DL96DRAFT_1684315 [Flagelloscypha sp. PMI_526]|nr:hypothetical protein DL96DRAFT_1684315 [Flagelloscypha sp. PMI_526]
MSRKLSHDVLNEIVHFVHDVDRPTIFSLNVVNNSFHSITLPFIYRECSFDLNEGLKPEDVDRIQTWMRPQSDFSWVLVAIRHLRLWKRVENRPWFQAVDPETWTLFLSLVSRTKNLSQLVFSIPDIRFPEKFLRTLETHTPNIRLVIEHWSMGRRDVNLNSEEELLARTPLLKELHVVNNAGPHDFTFIALRRLVSLAPRLEKLAVYAPSQKTGKSKCGNAWSGHDQTMALAEQTFRLPNSEMQPQTRRFRELDLTIAHSNFVEHCITILDPVCLERLETRLPLPSRTPPVHNHLSFTALRHLALEIYEHNPESVLSSFLLDRCTGTSLESFTLRTVSPIPETILTGFLDAHGPTLNSLDLRNDLPLVYGDANPTSYSIGRDSIRVIRDKCPILQRLSLCVRRANDEALDILTTFPPSLRHLTLNFGSGFSFFNPKESLMEIQEGSDINGQLKLPKKEIEEWEKTLWLQMPITVPTAEEIFRRLWKEGNGISSLERLVVKTRHPWSLGTRQEFSMERPLGGSDLKTTVYGYEIPQGQDSILTFDSKVPRVKRLQEMWMKVCPWLPFPKLRGKARSGL